MAALLEGAAMSNFGLRNFTQLRMANGGDPLQQHLQNKLSAGTLTVRGAGMLSDITGRNQSNDTQRYGMDTQAKTSRYGTDAQSATARMNDFTQRYGIDAQSTNARMNDATNRYGMDTQAETARLGQANQLGIAQLGDSTQRRGQDNSMTLGRLGDATQRIGQSNQLTLGQMGDATQRRGQDNQLALGQMGDATQRFGINTTANTSRYNSDNSLRASIYGDNASMRNADVSAETSRYGSDAAHNPLQYTDQNGKPIYWGGAGQIPGQIPGQTNGGNFGGAPRLGFGGGNFAPGGTQYRTPSAGGGGINYGSSPYPPPQLNGPGMRGADFQPPPGSYQPPGGHTGDPGFGSTPYPGTGGRENPFAEPPKYLPMKNGGELCAINGMELTDDEQKRVGRMESERINNRRTSGTPFETMASQDKANEFGGRFGMAKGGDLSTGKGGNVPGTGKGDKIPAKYEPGEFVVSNDMLKAKPGLRGMLRGLRKQVLADKGMTPQQADAKAMKGGMVRAEDSVNLPESDTSGDGDITDGKRKSILEKMREIDRQNAEIYQQSMARENPETTAKVWPIGTGGESKEVAPVVQATPAATSTVAPSTRYHSTIDDAINAEKKPPKQGSDLSSKLGMIKAMGADVSSLFDLQTGTTGKNIAAETTRQATLTQPDAKATMGTVPAVKTPVVTAPSTTPVAYTDPAERIKRQGADGLTAPVLVKGPDGRDYINESVSQADADESRRLLDSVRGQWGANSPNKEARAGALDTVNQAWAKRGAGIKAEMDPRGNGQLVLSNSNAAEKMAYVDTEGKPTTDYKKTSQYAQGVEVADRMAKYADKLAAQRDAEDQAVMRDRERVSLENAIPGAYEQWKRRWNNSVTLGSSQSNPEQIKAAHADNASIAGEAANAKANLSKFYADNMNADSQKAQTNATAKHYADSNAIEQQKLGLTRDKQKMEIDADKQLRAAQAEYIAAPEGSAAQKAAEHKLMVLSGKRKEPPAVRAMVVPGGQALSPDGVPYNIPSMVYDPDTKQVIRLDGQQGAQAKSQPPQNAVAMLKSNPNLAAAFDAKYGAGSAKQILGA